jgi:hypothetical protein
MLQLFCCAGVGFVNGCLSQLHEINNMKKQCATISLASARSFVENSLL